MPVPAPTKFVDAFAHNAGAGYINEIPETTSTPGAASLDQGFPPLTMTAPAAGGIPPFGQDMNGILFQATGGLSALQAGQFETFDSGYASAIGGYANGAILAMTDGTGAWLSIAANNSNDPDADGFAGNWVPICTTGLKFVTGVTGGSTTLTAAQYKKATLIFGGTLTSNATIILPTIPGQQWLAVNSCVGAFTLMIKTSAGTGVVIPPGTATSPTPIYCDGTNIQLATTPLTVAISTSPTPSTLAERDGTGNLLAVRFNSSATVENPAVGAVIVQNSAADGFFRKISIPNFLIALGFRSGSNSNGKWYLLPDGSIEQRGFSSGTGGGPVSITFPLAFPTACDCITATANDILGTMVTSLPSASRTGCTITNGANGSSTSWRATGT